MRSPSRCSATRSSAAKACAPRWPVKDRQLNEAEVKELQKALTKLGFDVGEIDGHPGEAVRSGVRQFQEKVGLTPDGYATPALLKRVKAGG